jgi:adenine-specific DNA-methyltransferase
MQNLKNILNEILKQDIRLWDKDQTELNQTLLFDLVDKIDETVIGLLLEKQEIREKFFVKIKDVYVFKTNDFKFFMEENKINNSYTQYKNRIGLSDGREFLKNRNEVVLDFPFKDCVLEGGQTTEEGIDTYFEYEEEKAKIVNGEKTTDSAGYKEKQAKRKETFFNQILARDEIDRLFDEKALVNWKRHTKDGEQKVGEINRDANGMIKENLIIKGNNLLALHSLKSQFAGKVKLIYIDPPYNTGNDGFKYNDNFNHSSWLVFMKNRLEIAKDLLRSDGVIFVQCDDNEQAYLKVLMDEVFGRENFVCNFVWKGRGGRQDSKFIAQIHETIILFSKNIKSLDINKKTIDDNSSYLFCDEKLKQNYKLQLVRKWGSNSKKEDRPNLFYGVKFKDEEIFPIHPDGSDGCWRWSKQKLEQAIKNNLIVKQEKNGKIELYEKIFETNGRREVTFTSWIESSFFGKGAAHIQQLFEERLFDYPKPEELLKHILEIATRENDLVLDFFAGSGTTLAVAHKMNRQYIGTEQMDYIHDLPESRLIKVVAGEQGGISKSVNWQGGGSFIYLELAQWNEHAKKLIQNAQDLNELIKLFDTLYEKYFLNYNLKINEFKELVIKEENFINLSLEEQKRMFLTMLDLNQMYVPKSEMEDKTFGISKEDQELTNIFYNEK